MAEPIVGINRARISPYSFLGRFQQKEKDDSQTSSALRQNQIALSSVNNSLFQITQQINSLSLSLQGISNQIKETSAIESLKEQQKARQEQILAEQQIREGKESQVERKIQNALSKPLRVVGAKAQGTLFNLQRFFNILLGGFLLNRILDSVADLSEKGKLTLKNLGDKIGKDLAIVGAIFLGVNGGLGLALGTVTRLAGFLTRIAVRGLLLAPIRLAFRIATSTLRGLRSLVRTAPRVPRTPASPRGPSPSTSRPPGRLSSGTGITTGATLASALSGESFGTILSTAIGGLMSNRLAMKIRPSSPGGTLAQVLVAGGVVLAPILYKKLIAPSLEQGVSGFGSNLYDLFGALTGSNKRNLEPPDSSPDVTSINVNGGGGAQGTQQEVPSTAGEATYLPAIGSSNPDNFYLLYSQIQYNVVG